MYPIANVIRNSFGFTLFESFLERNLFDPLEKGVGATSALVTGSVTTVLPIGSGEPPRAGESPPADEPTSPPLQPEPEPVTSQARRYTRRTLAEVMAIPLSIGLTIIVTPIDYAYIQARGLATRPFSHLMDSLAQLPLLEIPVAGASRLFRPENPWGRRGKGIFTLGPLHEGMGRMYTPELLRRESVPVYSIRELQGMDAAPKGVFVVDTSSIVKKGAFGMDLSKPWFDFTLAWLDPIGAHSDFTNKQIMDLLSWMANGTPLLQDASKN
jgi:hypothetical protein